MKTFLHRWIPALLTVTALVSLLAPSYHAQITQPPAGVADLLFTPDATWDIGKTGATRARDLFISRNGTVGGTLGVTGVLTAPGVPTLLKANSGTSTAAGATNVDTVAITGLTALDTLTIEVTLESITQATANPTLQNVTDTVAMLSFLSGGASIPAAGVYTGTAKMRQRQQGATKIAMYAIGHDPVTGFVGGGDTWGSPNFTTAWTGSWTLGLRHGGVTAGGTLQWSWAVYKVPGQ